MFRRNSRDFHVTFCFFTECMISCMPTGSPKCILNVLWKPATQLKSIRLSASFKPALACVSRKLHLKSLTNLEPQRETTLEPGALNLSICSPQSSQPKPSIVRSVAPYCFRRVCQQDLARHRCGDQVCPAVSWSSQALTPMTDIKEALSELPLIVGFRQMLEGFFGNC